MTDESAGTNQGRRSKVARLLEAYDLEGLGAEMEARWTADEDRMSLRSLAEFFNQEVLRERLEEADIETLDGEVGNIYRLLTDDDVSTADRTRVRRRLEREGLDIDSIEDDFVTYQAVRSYLKDYRDAEYVRDDRDPLTRETENVERLRGRVETVTDGKLDQLRNQGEISMGEYRTVVDIQVVCEGCHTQYGILELFERGGCKCE